VIIVVVMIMVMIKVMIAAVFHEADRDRHGLTGSPRMRMQAPRATRAIGRRQAVKSKPGSC